MTGADRNRVDPDLTAGDPLQVVADHSGAGAAAAMLQLIAAGCRVGIAITQYAVLRGSGWRIAATPLMALACVLALLRDTPVTSYVTLAAPLGGQEIVLALWLIAGAVTFWVANLLVSLTPICRNYRAP